MLASSVTLRNQYSLGLKKEILVEKGNKIKERNWCDCGPFEGQYLIRECLKFMPDTGSSEGFPRFFMERDFSEKSGFFLSKYE